MRTVCVDVVKAIEVEVDAVDVTITISTLVEVDGFSDLVLVTVLLSVQDV